MVLTLQRRKTLRDTTFGDLFLGADWQCYTLEDVVREQPGVPVAEWKQAGRTAIPEGEYELALADSPKFGPNTLTLLDVPGFAYIRIHAGNDDGDTEGCILVGEALLEDPHDDGGNVLRSRRALDALKAQLVPLIEAGERVTIRIKNARLT